MSRNEVLKKIVKEIRIIKKKNSSNGRVTHKLLLELNGGYSTEIPMVEEEIQLISLLKQIGYDEPIKSKELVEEISNETGEVYLCVKIVLADDTVLRYFLPHNNGGFRFKTIIEKLVEFTLKQEKENQNKENIVKQNK